MEPQTFDAQWVVTSAAAQNLVIPPEHLAAVVANLQRIAAIAAPLLDEQLAVQDEPGPVFRP